MCLVPYGKEAITWTNVVKIIWPHMVIRQHIIAWTNADQVFNDFHAPFMYLLMYYVY